MIRRQTLATLSRLGLAQPSLKLYDWLIGMPTEHDEFEIDITPTSAPADDGLVVFPYPHHAKSHTLKYSVLGEAFKRRGITPLFVLPDNCLPISCLQEDNPTESVVCEVREYATKNVLEEFGHEWTYLTDYVGDAQRYQTLSVESIDTSDYHGVNLDAFATASTRKITKKYHIDTDRDVNIRRRFLRSGVLLVDAFEQFIDTHSPTCMIAHDDKYNQGGIPLAVAAAHSTHAYSSTYGWMNESIVLGNVAHRNSFPHYEAKDVVEPFLRRPLTPSQKQRVDDIMTDRMHGDDETRARYAAQTSTSINAAADDVTVGMFMNLIWDANLEVNNCPYPDVFDWICETIATLGGQTDLSLVIKPHPAEASRGTTESVRTWIQNHYEPLPDNVSVLRPDTEVNTYEMIADIDAGLVYNSTVGFEMVYTGTPAITAGETHYRGLGLTHDPATAAEYTDLLEGISQLSVSEPQQRRAARYIYFLLEGKHLEFPFIETTDVRQYNYPPVTDVCLDQNETLDHIVHRCTAGHPVFTPELDWLVAPPAEST
jgi:hypothetical protein